MAQEPLACLFELLPDSVVIAAEFFQCFNPFSGEFENHLCCLTSGLLSIFRIKGSKEDEEENTATSAVELELEDYSLHLVLQERVFGKLQAIKACKLGPGQSDLLIIAVDDTRIVGASYHPFRNALDMLFVEDLETNFVAAANDKKTYLGHGRSPLLITDAEHSVLGASIFGEQLFFCQLKAPDADEGVAGVTSSRFTTNLLRDHGLVGPILDISFVYGSRYPTFAVLQQENFLTIGHAMKVMHTCVVSVLSVDFISKKTVLLWKKNALPHDCLQLVDLRSGSLPGLVLVTSQNAVLAVQEEIVTALPTNGFASVTLNASKVRVLPLTTIAKGLELHFAQWVQYGSASEKEASFIGFLRNGTVVLVHLQLVIPELPSSATMEIVILREGVHARCAAISPPGASELLFIGARQGSNALYRTQYNSLVKHVEKSMGTPFYAQTFVQQQDQESLNEMLEEEKALYGPDGLDVERSTAQQWVIDIRLLDTLFSTGPFHTGYFTKPDDYFAQIDHIRWNRSAPVTILHPATTQSYIPEREIRDQLVLCSGFDQESALHRVIVGIGVRKVGTRSFPGAKNLFSVETFDKTLIFLSYANKTRVFQCTKIGGEINTSSSSSSSGSVKFNEWLADDSGLICNARTVLVTTVAATSCLVVQITAQCIRLLRVLESMETEPVQDMLITDGYELGGLGGTADEQIIAADALSTHITILSSALNVYLLRYNPADEILELVLVEKSSSSSSSTMATDDIPSDHPTLKGVQSPILAVSLFQGVMQIISTDWMLEMSARDQKRKEKMALSDIEAEELLLYGEEKLEEVDTKDALLPLSGESSPPVAQEAHLIIAEKDGYVSIFRLSDMVCLLRTLGIFLQLDHIPLGTAVTTDATSNGVNEATQAKNHFIVEAKLFRNQRKELFLIVLFSGGEVVLYKFHEVRGIAVALNKVLRHSLHSRGYPGAVFFRGVNSSETTDLPASFLSELGEYICRLGPTIQVTSKGVFLSANDPRILSFEHGYPLLLPVAFPETPLVNFGQMTIFPLFEDGDLLATLWFEYEDIDTAASEGAARLHRIKNRPLKQAMFGIYHRLPRQQPIASSGQGLSLQTIAAERTVHKCQEILKITDNKTEQALLDKKTFMLLTSHQALRPFNPQVIGEADNESEDFMLERYFPSLESFQQPNPSCAPIPLQSATEYRVSLLQNGKIVDNYMLPENEKVLDASVMYFTLERMGVNMAKSVEKRIFVIISTIFVDKRGEDTQGLGRILLMGMDYAMFEEDLEKVEVEQQQQQQKENPAQSQPEGEDRERMQVDENSNTDNHHPLLPHEDQENGHRNGHSHSSNENSSNGHQLNGQINGQSKVTTQEQFLGAIQPKLRLIWTGPGPASVVYQVPALSPTPTDSNPFSNYVIATVGTTLYIYKFNSVTLEMDQVAFYFAQFYVTSVSMVKQFIVIGDLLHSVQLLYFREEDFSIHLVAKDFDARTILRTELLVDGQKLGIITTDDHGHLQLFQYKRSESVNGSRLICLADLYLGSDISFMASHDLLYPEAYKRGAITVAPTACGSLSMVKGQQGARKISHFPLQQFGSRMLKTCLPVNRKTCNILATVEGGISVLLPLDEKVFKRLASLEQILNMLLPPPLGIPARAYRMARHTAQHVVSATNAKKTILDGCSLIRYLQLESPVQEEIAAMIGSNAIFLRENLREMEYSLRFF